MLALTICVDVLMFSGLWTCPLRPKIVDYPRIEMYPKIIISPEMVICPKMVLYPKTVTLNSLWHSGIDCGKEGEPKRDEKGKKKMRRAGRHQRE